MGLFKNIGGFQQTDAPSTTVKVSGTAAANSTISAGNAPCTLSFATVTNYQYTPGLVWAGFDASVTVANLQIRDYAGTVYAQVPVSGGVPQVFNLDKLLLPVSTGLVVALQAGGVSGIKGYLNVFPNTEAAHG